MSEVSVVSVKDLKQKVCRLNDEIRDINCCGENVCCANSSKSIYDEVHYPSSMEEEPLTAVVVAGKWLFSNNT